MNDINTIRGTVEGFERSTHTTGVRHRTSTTHLSMFNVNSYRVILRTPIPSVISDGDEVVIAGTNSDGQFHALACKNKTANWISPLKQQRCAFTALICIAIVWFCLFFLVLPLIFGGVCIFFAIKVKKHDNMMRKAHELIVNA